MNPAEAACAVIVDELLRAGVVDFVLAPGHRSAPLAVAVAGAASAGECSLHVRTDERVAGFLALGLSRASGRPVAIICTSGSAVANLLPAVTEADADGLPLVLVTADRPAELLGVGANQTIDQVGIFGSRVRRSTALEAPHWHDGAVRYWRSATSQIVNAAIDVTDPGPVHLNVALRAPLLAGETEAEPPYSLDGRPNGLPWTVDARLVSVAAVSLHSLLEQMGYEPRPLRGAVMVGHLAIGEPYASEAIALAEALDWPLLSEPSGNARSAGTSILHGPLLCQDTDVRRALQPEVVVTVGRLGLHRGVNAMVAAAGWHIAVDPAPARAPTDPLRSADVVVSAVPAPDDSCRAPEGWSDRWIAADDAAGEAIAKVLAGHTFCGPDAVRSVWEATPADGLLLPAASWPVRFLDSYVGARSDPPWVIGNRGASGIDGLISTAWGAALAHQRPPSVWAQAAGGLTEEYAQAGGTAVALLGDLASLYDVTGLIAPPGEPRPDLVVVVLDNDGGGIFSALEPANAAYREYFERVFGTPTGQDIAAWAAAAGVDAVRVDNSAALEESLVQAIAAGGVHVIVCDVGTRQTEADIVQRLQQGAVAAAKFALET